MNDESSYFNRFFYVIFSEIVPKYIQDAFNKLRAELHAKIDSKLDSKVNQSRSEWIGSAETRKFLFIRDVCWSKITFWIIIKRAIRIL